MKRIRDSSTIIGTLEQGEAVQKLSREITETLMDLKEQTGDRPGVKIKGSVTLKINIEVKDGTAILSAEVSSKRPKPVPGTTFFWVLDDGSLSMDHPSQTDMFGGPREVRGARDVTDVSSL